MTLHADTLLAQLDRNSACYDCGEKAIFSPFLVGHNCPLSEGQVEYELLIDNQKPLESGVLDLQQGPKTVEAGLNRPGFIECRFRFQSGQEPALEAKIGAAFAPTGIMPSLPVPDDFNKFWAKQKAGLAKVPVAVKRTALACGSLDLSDVQIDSVDNTPVSGYLAFSRGAARKSLPAVILLHGAGVGSAGIPFDLAERGFLAFDINAHGLPNGREEPYYQQIAEGRLADYRQRGFRSGTEDVYFLGMFLRVKRAIDFICMQPEWDGKNLFLSGSSQGGYQTLAGAYLDSRVTAIAVGVPAGSDLTGSLCGRVRGWPLADAILDPTTPEGETELRTVRYFDNMNFAAHIQIPAIFSVGYVDGTCKPSTVYAVYNAYAGPKQMLDNPRMGHEHPPIIYDRFFRFLMEQAGL